MNKWWSRYILGWMHLIEGIMYVGTFGLYRFKHSPTIWWCEKSLRWATEEMKRRRMEGMI